MNGKGFSSRAQGVGMLFCQLAQARRRREISDGLAATGGKLNHLGLPPAAAPAVPFALRSIAVPPGGAATLEPVYLSRAVGLAGQPVRGAARATAGAAGIGVWDSTGA